MILITKMLYSIIGFEVIAAMFFLLKRLYMNIGDRKIENYQNEIIERKKRLLGKVLKSVFLLLVVTVLLTLLYSNYYHYLIK